MDMSLPDRVAVLERKIERLRQKAEWQDERQDETIEKIGNYLTAVMTFLDGARLDGLVFKKEPLDLGAIKQQEEPEG